MGKRYDKAFKTKIFIEVLWGEKILQELAKVQGLQSKVIALWKKRLLESAEQVV